MRGKRLILVAATGLIAAPPIPGTAAEFATVPQKKATSQAAVLRNFRHRRYPNAWLAAQKSRRPILLR